MLSSFLERNCKKYFIEQNIQNWNHWRLYIGRYIFLILTKNWKFYLITSITLIGTIDVHDIFIYDSRFNEYNHLFECTCNVIDCPICYFHIISNTQEFYCKALRSLYSNCIPQSDNIFKQFNQTAFPITYIMRE